MHAAAAHPDEVAGFLDEAVYGHVVLVQVFQVRPPRALHEVQTIPAAQASKY